MSKWTDEYNKAIELFEKIKDKVDNLDCGSNEECYRFKKMFNIQYNIAKNLEPELISIKDIYKLIYSDKVINGTGYNFGNFLNKLFNELNKDNINLYNLNDLLDSISNVLKPYVLHKKRFGDPLVNSVKVYQEELNKYLKQLKKIEQEEQKLKEVIEQIYKYDKELFKNSEDKISIKSKIENIFNEIEEKKEDIYNFYNKLFVDEGKESIKTKINKFYEEIENIKEKSKSLKDEIENLLSNTKNTIKDLKNFYVDIFGEEDEATGELKGGLKKELEIRVKELDELKIKFSENITEQTKHFNEILENQEKKYNELYKKIESLLPGATSTGLAKAYEEKRKKFERQTHFWSGFFIFAMAILFYEGYKIVLNLDNIKTINDMFTHMLKYFPFYAPVIWLAFYAGKRRNENMRLEQKYAHKESLAKSYISYKKQIEQLDSEARDELLENLLRSSTYIISEDPSYVLDKNNSEYHPIIESVYKIGDFVKSKKTDKSVK